MVPPPFIVTELDVLPSCEFKPGTYAQPRKVEKYAGVYEVYQSNIYPKEETWFHTKHIPDKVNTEINTEVYYVTL